MKSEDKRDLRQDLEICEKATPNLRIERNNLWFSIRTGYGVSDKLVADCLKARDAEFFVAARQGWPWYIKRVQELEKRALELEEENKKLHANCRKLEDALEEAVHDLDYFKDAIAKIINNLEQVLQPAAYITDDEDDGYPD